MVDFSSLNWLAILLAATAYFVIGGLWFAPFGFQKSWDKAIGFSRPKTWKAGPSYYIVPFLGCLTITLATAVLLHATSAQSFVEAITLGLIVGIGYAAAVASITAVAPTTPRPSLLAVLIGSYHTVGIVIVSAILFAWK
jgi:hypothetical protein